MKSTKHYLALIALLFMVSYGATAQTTYQNWTAFPDSPTHLEVSWQTVQCAPLLADQIRLYVFNESGTARTADFAITISDSSQTDVIHTVTAYSLTAGQSVRASCGNGNFPELTIDVPSGFDPNTLTMTIKYNN